MHLQEEEEEDDGEDDEVGEDIPQQGEGSRKKDGPDDPKGGGVAGSRLPSSRSSHAVPEQGQGSLGRQTGSGGGARGRPPAKQGIGGTGRANAAPAGHPWASLSPSEAAVNSITPAPVLGLQSV